MAHTNYSRNSRTGDENVTLDELKRRPEYEITKEDKCELVRDEIKRQDNEIASLENLYNNHNYLDFHESMRLNKARILKAVLEEYKPESTVLRRIKVCTECHSVGITHRDCVCVDGKYETVELEFEACACCGNITQDGTTADTEFNRKQLETK